MSDVAIVAVVALVMVVAIVALYFGRGFRGHVNVNGLDVEVPDKPLDSHKRQKVSRIIDQSKAS
jgi:hypothetical protein